MTGSEGISSRVARELDYRKTACGPCFPGLRQHKPCKAADPRHPFSVRFFSLVPALLGLVQKVSGICELPHIGSAKYRQAQRDDGGVSCPNANRRAFTNG